MNKHPQKLATVIFTTAFAAAMTTTAFAEETMLISANPLTTQTETAVMQEEVMGLSTMQGKISEIGEENGIPTITVSNEFETMIFYVQDAYLMDTITGQIMSITNMLDQEVRVYYGPEVTYSLPAQSVATAVFTASEAAIANYAVIEAVAQDQDGNLVVTTDGGSRLITISKEAKVTPWLTKNIVGLDDLIVGSEVVLYYDLLTMSIPAQAYTEQVILLNNHASVMSEKTDVTEAGENMIPLRQMAEELGMTVEWNAADRSVIFTKDTFSGIVRIDSVNAGINKMRVVLTKEAKLINHTTYIPASFAEEIRAALNE